MLTILIEEAYTYDKLTYSIINITHIRSFHMSHLQLMSLQTLDVLTPYRFDEEEELPKGISDPDSGCCWMFMSCGVTSNIYTTVYRVERLSNRARIVEYCTALCE
jgi:hypothetical protein